jgi:hypothetical protein
VDDLPIFSSFRRVKRSQSVTTGHAHGALLAPLASESESDEAFCKANETTTGLNAERRLLPVMGWPGKHLPKLERETQGNSRSM